MAVSEEEIIRQRLLFDGEGTGEDRRIQTLLKTIVKWCNTDANRDECNLTYQRIIALLNQCEYAMIKNHLVYEMNMKERKNYEALFKEIEQGIMQAKEDIAQCKVELQQAKKIRKNRQEYDALAKVIELHPDRKQSQAETDALKEDLTRLEQTKNEILKKLDVRGKQLHALVHCIHVLQQTLDADSSSASSNKPDEVSMDVS
eukprot:gene19976-21934_t